MNMGWSNAIFTVNDDPISAYAVIDLRKSQDFSLELDWVGNGVDALLAYSTNDPRRAEVDTHPLTGPATGWKTETVIAAALGVGDGSNGGDILDVSGFMKRWLLLFIANSTGTTNLYKLNVQRK